MTSSDGSGRDPLDPDFAGLFRPEDLATPSPVADATADAYGDDDEPHFEPIMDPVLDPRAEQAAHDAEQIAAAVPVAPPAPESAGSPPADPVADTGRIFRSQGVVGHDDAVLALAGDRRLRTLERRYDDAPPAEVLVPAAAAAVDPESPSVHHVIPAPDQPSEAPVSEPARSRMHRSRSITAGAVYIVVIGVTLVVAFLNAWLAGGDLGWPTGLALLISSVYAALTVRRSDDTAAIVIPPVAFLIAALTAGQVFIGSVEGSLLNRAVIVFFTLADNWVWIIGATVAALAIVLVRRRRG